MPKESPAAGPFPSKTQREALPQDHFVQNLKEEPCCSQGILPSPQHVPFQVPFSAPGVAPSYESLGGVFTASPERALRFRVRSSPPRRPGGNLQPVGGTQAGPRAQRGQETPHVLGQSEAAWILTPAGQPQLPRGGHHAPRRPKNRPALPSSRVRACPTALRRPVRADLCRRRSEGSLSVHPGARFVSGSPGSAARPGAAAGSQHREDPGVLDPAPGRARSESPGSPRRPARWRGSALLRSLPSGREEGDGR